VPAKLTVEQWKSRYLFGVPDINPATSEPFAHEDYQYHLDLGYEALELILDVSILPTEVVDERHDYYLTDYQSWGYIRTFKKPVREVHAVEGKYPYYQTALRIPQEWIVVDQMTGIVNLIPVAGTLSQFIMTSGGQLLPHLFRFMSHVPRFWSLSYTAGFNEGEIPMDLNDAAAKMACMSVLNILGDLVGGVGVLGTSIGMDGLSQFISLTKTATTSAFYSRVLAYRTDLYGQGMGGPGSQIHSLKRRYRGIRIINL
jgi:hypothetical protein